MSETLKFIQKTGLLRGRAKSTRPRRQVKKARKLILSYVENVFGRQRRHRTLQPSIVELVVWIHSTGVENVRQIRLFLQNKPNFPCFSPENNDLTQKQTQFKAKTNPIQSQFWADIKGDKPNQTQFIKVRQGKALSPIAAINRINLYFMKFWRIVICENLTDLPS